MNNKVYEELKRYKSHKIVKATLLTRGDYNILQGWEIPKDENPKDEGYLVEYIDSPSDKHKDFTNYISWSPKDVFEAGYTEEGTVEVKEFFGIGEAVLAMTTGGYKVKRTGWNGKGMYLTYKSGYPDGVKANKAHAVAHNIEVGSLIIYDPYIEMRTATGSFIPWICSQADLLATDYTIVK